MDNSLSKWVGERYKRRRGIKGERIRWVGRRGGNMGVVNEKYCS